MTSLSIIVCSRDRAPALSRCLDALPAVAMRDADAELVVVDNGSTDGTAERIAAFAARATFPVQAVHEPTPGLSRARNAGLRAATGSVLAFTDDDCCVAEDFPQLAAHVFDGAPFRYCGGRILLPDPTDARYCYLDSEQRRLFPPGSALLPGQIQGSNMLVHREVVLRIGGFDPLLGAGTAFRAEDIDYLARASAAGFGGAYVPELVVHHHHGRKPGPELRALQRANDVARGAFFAKFADLGRREYARRWLWQSLRPWKLASSLRVWRGACAWRRFVAARGIVPQLCLPLAGAEAS